MASVLKVDKLDPQSGTALEIGTSGDTVTVPTGAGLTVTDEVKTNKISPATGTAFALGDSGDTFTVPSGATIVNSGTATGFGGGKLLQFQYTTLGTNDTSIASTSFLDITGAILTFTPTSASSKLLMEFNVTCNTNTTNVNNGIMLRYYSDTDTAILNDGALDAQSPAYSLQSATLDYMRVKIHFCYLHPSWGTSANIIQLQAAGTINTDQIRFNRSAYGQYGLFSIKEIDVS